MSELASLGLDYVATRKDNVVASLAWVREIFAERAAIREHLGEMSRRQAERYALSDTVDLLGPLQKWVRDHG